MWGGWLRRLCSVCVALRCCRRYDGGAVRQVFQEQYFNPCWPGCESKGGACTATSFAANSYPEYVHLELLAVKCASTSITARLINCCLAERVLSKSINSCLSPVGSLDGASIVTAEGIGCSSRGFHAIQGTRASICLAQLQGGACKASS